jgi:hypothetical protein
MQKNKIDFQEYVKDAPLAGTAKADYTAKNWINRYKREKYVYDKMVEYAKYMNREELKHAERYINKYYKDFGITDASGNPIQEILPFNLNDIPKKRQEVNIDKILNLK